MSELKKLDARLGSAESEVGLALTEEDPVATSALFFSSTTSLSLASFLSFLVLCSDFYRGSAKNSQFFATIPRAEMFPFSLKLHEFAAGTRSWDPVSKFVFRRHREFRRGMAPSCPAPNFRLFFGKASLFPLTQPEKNWTPGRFALGI